MHECNERSATCMIAVFLMLVNRILPSCKLVRPLQREKQLVHVVFILVAGKRVYSICFSPNNGQPIGVFMQA